MDKKSCSSSLLPWFWILEYLSSCKDVDTSLLNDLIEKAPDLSHNLAKNAREMISLRCLQDLFVCVNAEEDSEVPILRTGFRPEDTCENVVKHIMIETPLSESATAAVPKMKKWDALPFIMQKKVSLPKCALLQVKDLMTSDSCKFPEALKQRSKLFHRDEHFNVTNTDGRNDAPSGSRENKIDLSFPTTDPQNESTSKDVPNISFSFDKSKGGIMSEATTVQLPGNANTVSDDDLNSNEMKRRKISSSNGVCPEENTQQQVPVFGANPKKDAAKTHVFSKTRGVVLDESPSKKEPENVREDIWGDLHSNSKNEGAILHPNGKSIEENLQQESAPLEELCATARNFSTEVQDKEDVHMDNDGKNTGINKRKANEDQHMEDEEHNLFEGLLDVDPSTSDRVHVDMEDEDVVKKHYLSSSQWTVLLKSSELADCIEKYSCVKCNKGGGQLMVCSSSSCPIMAHEGCLGSNPYFDELGNFYCPFCAYTHAMSEYMEANKKSSLARKCLASFIGVDFEKHRQQGELTDICGGGKNQPNEVRITEMREPSTPKFCEIETNINHENSKPQEHKNETPMKKSAPGIMENSNISTPEIVANVFNDSEIEDDSCRSGNEDVLNATCNQPKITQDPGKLSVPLKSVLNSLSGEVDLHDDKHEQKSSSETVVDGLPTQGKHVTPPRDEARGTSVNRSRRETNRDSYASVMHLPMCRRRKIPWTILEEETLKEGVEKFSSDDCKNIPWKRILEFGILAFEKGRTTVDLKDKWRNMCRKISS